MHEDFQFTIDNQGPPQDAKPLTREQVAFFKQHFPDSFYEFITIYGLGHYFDRGWWLVDPQEYRPLLALIFKADPDFDHNSCHLVGYSAFGDLRIWSEKYFTILVDLLTYEVTNQKLAPSVSNIPLPKLENPRPITAENLVSGVIPDEKEVRELWDFPENEPMFKRCVKEHGALERGECYGFVPSLGMVGFNSKFRRVEYVKRVKALEHFCMIAQMQDFVLTLRNKGRKEIVRTIG